MVKIKLFFTTIILIIIIFLSFYTSFFLLKKNLNYFIQLNKNCEFLCKNPVKAYEEKLLKVKKFLPEYEKVGFISDTCKNNKNLCRLEYKMTRYILYPTLLENSTNYDLVVGIFKGTPKYEENLEPKIIFDDGIILFKRIKGNKNDN